MQLRRNCCIMLMLSFSYACDSDPIAAPKPLIAADAHLTWKQTRACRISHEHWLHGVRVVVNELAWQPYVSWLPYEKGNQPFPVGAMVVKPEYNDDKCIELLGYTVMRKESPGYWPQGNDWQWFELDATGMTVKQGKLTKECVTCHVQHCALPNGFDLTCTPD